jgi:hypothetical protein
MKTEDRGLRIEDGGDWVGDDQVPMTNVRGRKMTNA